jgi:hypothetical protein
VKPVSCHARQRSSHIERRRLDFVPSVRVMHRRVLCRRGVPLRGPDIHGLAGRLFLLPSFLARRRSWVPMPFAGLFPRTGGMAFLPFRAHVSLRRRASAPINFRRGDRSPGLECNSRELRKAVGRGLSLWRGVRLLGFTPICDPHPPACGQRTDPALGFASCRVCGRESAHTIGLDPESHHRPPGSGASLIVSRFARPNPLMRFRRCFAGPFSVLMGPMPGLA